MAAAGMQDKVEVLSSVKNSIENARTHLSGGTDLIEQAMNEAKAAGG